MTYDDVPPIRARSASPFVVEFADGSRLLELWAPDTDILDVRAHVERMYPGQPFALGIVSVGSFVIKEVVSAYSPDGRRIDRDLSIVL